MRKFVYVSNYLPFKELKKNIVWHKLTDTLDYFIGLGALTFFRHN